MWTYHDYLDTENHCIFTWYVKHTDGRPFIKLFRTREEARVACKKLNS